MRAEISQVRKEANFYLDNLEKSKAIIAMEERKKKKRKVADNLSQEDVVRQNFIVCKIPKR